MFRNSGANFSSREFCCIAMLVTGLRLRRRILSFVAVDEMVSAGGSK
jgi:hypothetical protein